MIVAVKGADQVAARLTRLNRELPNAMERGISRISIQVRNELVLQLSGRTGSSPFFGRTGASGSHLGVRTGGTRSRISPGGRVFRRGNEIFSPVGSPDPHVRFHEEGGTIIGNQYLRIPLRTAQTAAGQDRFMGMSIRDIPGAFLIRTMGGKLFAARQRGQRVVEFLYLLVRSVTHRPRKMFEAVTLRMRPVAVKTLNLEIGLQVRKANGG